MWVTVSSQTGLCLRLVVINSEFRPERESVVCLVLFQVLLVWVDQLLEAACRFCPYAKAFLTLISLIIEFEHLFPVNLDISSCLQSFSTCIECILRLVLRDLLILLWRQLVCVTLYCLIPVGWWLSTSTKENLRDQLIPLLQLVTHTVRLYFAQSLFGLLLRDVQ